MYCDHVLVSRILPRTPWFLILSALTRRVLGKSPLNILISCFSHVPIPLQNKDFTTNVSAPAPPQNLTQKRVTVVERDSGGARGLRFPDKSKHFPNTRDSSADKTENQDVCKRNLRVYFDIPSFCFVVL